MNYLPVVLAAYFLNSISVTIDKLLLSKKDTHPALYVFYISVFSLVVLVMIPFTHIPTLSTIVIASISTLLWTAGAYYMFKAIQIGSVSRVVPIIGSGIPLLLALYAAYNGIISNQHIIAVLILVVGLIALTKADWRTHITKREIAFELVSIVLFAISYIVLRQAYLQDTFLSVFVWSRPILIILGAIILIIPHLRTHIFKPKNSNFSLLSRNGALFMSGQAAGGASGLLLTYAISLADPALVNSLQGTQYVFLFTLSLLLSKKYPDAFETLNKKALLGKIIGIICIAIGLYILTR